ncbi:hypothetical protein COO60DRAFT_1457906 [Scenedesmus sp. NREL 46B-D3]|nr:hypothetical protein COO60DRAFT_1457906 [Scenedesmus sp. NREL 46B-D3]
MTEQTNNRLLARPEFPGRHKTALYMLNVLGKYKDADPFRLPVDWKSMGIPDYPVVIKHPMDFKTAREEVRAGAYASMDEWRADMQLIWDNCRKYNGDNHNITRSAEKMEAFMERRMEEAIAGAARELAAAQQRAGAGGLAGRGTAGGSKTTQVPREVALLRASHTPSGSDSDGDEDGRQAWPALRAAHLLLCNITPALTALCRVLLYTGLCARRLEAAASAFATARIDMKATCTAAEAGPAAAHGMAGPAKRRRLASNGLSGGGLLGVPAAADDAVPGAAAGNRVPGADDDALEQLGNSQAAEQLGTSDADDLALLAVWKRVVAKRTQAASEAQRVQHAANQLKRSLMASEEEAFELRDMLDEEAATRADVERQLTEMQEQYTKLLEEERKEQHKHAGKWKRTGVCGDQHAEALSKCSQMVQPATPVCSARILQHGAAASPNSAAKLVSLACC